MGATADGAPLVVDAMLPVPTSSGRFMLLGVLAVAALVALIWFAIPPDAPSDDKQEHKTHNASTEIGETVKPGDGKPKPKDAGDNGHAHRNPQDVKVPRVYKGLAAGLAEWLKSPEGKADKIEIQLEDEGKLELLERGLVIQAPGEIVIKGKSQAGPWPDLQWTAALAQADRQVAEGIGRQ